MGKVRPSGQNEGLETLAQHSAIFLPVVSMPPFPQGIGTNTIIGHSRIRVRNHVVNRLPLPQPYTTAEQLLRGDSRQAGLTVIARLARNALADDKFLDRDATLFDPLQVTVKHFSCFVELPAVSSVIARLREYGQSFALHFGHNGRRVVAA